MSKGIQTVNPIFTSNLDSEKNQNYKGSNGLMAMLIPISFVIGVLSGMAFLSTVYQENSDIHKLKVKEIENQLVQAQSYASLASLVSMWQSTNSDEYKAQIISTLDGQKNLKVVQMSNEFTVVSLDSKELYIPFRLPIH